MDRLPVAEVGRKHLQREFKWEGLTVVELDMWVLLQEELEQQVG